MEPVGWTHQGLINLAEKFGVSGSRESIGQNLEKIAPHVERGELVIASVTVGFEAGRKYKNPDGSESCKSRFEYFIKGTENLSNNLKIEKTTVPVNRDTGKMTTVDDPAHEMKEKSIIKDSFSTYCQDCTPDYPVPTISPTPAP